MSLEKPLAVSHSNTENTQPIPENSAINHEQVLESQEDTVALSGLGMLVTKLRLGLAERKLESLEEEDVVIRHTAIEAQNLRGFGSELQDPRTIPITHSERHSQRSSERSVRRKRKSQIESYRISQGYSEPVPEHRREARVTRSTSGTAAAERWNKAAEKFEQQNNATDVSFDHAPRERRGTRKAVDINRRAYRTSQNTIDRVDRDLSRKSTGNTYRGRKRQQAIDRQEAKIRRLDAKLAGESYEQTRTEKAMRATLNTIKKGSRKVATTSGRYARQYANHIKAEYQTGLSEDYEDDGAISRTVNKVARAGGRRVGKIIKQRKPYKQNRSVDTRPSRPARHTPDIENPTTEKPLTQPRSARGQRFQQHLDSNK